MSGEELIFCNKFLLCSLFCFSCMVYGVYHTILNSLYAFLPLLWNVGRLINSVVTCEVTTIILCLNIFLRHQNAVILQQEIPITCEVTDNTYEHQVWFTYKIRQACLHTFHKSVGIGLPNNPIRIL